MASHTNKDDLSQRNDDDSVLQHNGTVAARNQSLPFPIPSNGAQPIRSHSRLLIDQHCGLAVGSAREMNSDDRSNEFQENINLSQLSTSASELELDVTDMDLNDPFDDFSDNVSNPRKSQASHQYRRSKSLYGASPSCKFGPKASVMKTQAAVLTIQDPGCQRLVWYKKPITVLVIKKVNDEGVIQPFIDLLTFLIEVQRMMVYIDVKNLDEPLLKHNNDFTKHKSHVLTFTEGQDDLTDKIDFIICLGGDGTLIYASSLFQGNVPPVMAFHLGSLGFLMSIEFSNFREKVKQVLEGNVPLTLRTRLKCSLAKSGTYCSDTKKCSIKNVESKTHNMVLNEVVVDRGPCPYLCNIDLYIDHRYVTSVQGDGLIIATPTGSTAYAAAAGASMVHPNVPAIIIVPICPHSLSFRPIVVPAGVEIRIMVAHDGRGSASVAFDGRNRCSLEKGDVLRISTSIYPVPSICGSDQISDWFDSLAECLHWNVRKQQKAFHPVSSTDSLDSCRSSPGQQGSSSSNGSREQSQENGGRHS